ncbi:MAG: ABC transporter permease subunit [Propionibacteriaceae bacterium]|nr:ABC transporter permease subunit [Propionibacteriaceae bacterium]
MRTPSRSAERSRRRRSTTPASAATRGAAVALFWLALWQLASLAVGQELLLPAPATVAATLGELVVTAAFWQVTAWSLLRVGLGFLAGVVVGCGAAVLTVRYQAVDLLLSPALRVVRAAPVASFIILVLVWIPVGRLPGFISFLMVVPVVWDAMTTGLRSQSPELLEMATVFRLGWWPTLRRVRLPQLAPFFVTASTTAMGLAWKSGIAAEVIARPPLSIGRQLQDAKIYLETPAVFAWTITAVGLSLLLEGLLRRATHRWRTSQALLATPPAKEGDDAAL